MSNVDLPSVAAGTYKIQAAFEPLRGLKLILDQLGPTTLCALEPDTGVSRGCWLDRENLDHTCKWVEKHNADGFNIYFTLNLPKPGLAKKPSKAEITALRGLPADIDAKHGRSLADAFALVGNVQARPNLIIATGGGFQPIWMFPERLPANAKNVGRVEAAGKRLVKVTGSDPIQNIDRILRMPFTMNFPNKKKIAAGRVVCPSGLVLPTTGGLDGQRKS